jgi:hypothetical protein
LTSDLKCKIADFGISDNLAMQDEMGHKELYTSLIPPECKLPNHTFDRKGDVYVKILFVFFHPSLTNLFFF